jgi:hypothetical protein
MMFHKEITVRTRITTFWSIVLSIFGFGLTSTMMAAEAPPPALVAETFACSYKEGKDWDDKSKARDNLVAQVEKAGLKKIRAIHWTQKKGMAPVDTVWFDIHENIGAFAAASDAWDASGIGKGVSAQFGKVEDCTAGLSLIRPFHQAQDGGEDDEGDDTTLVANLACTFKQGSGFEHMPDLARHMGAAVASFGADGPGFAAVRQPITAGPNYPDLFIFSVFDDMTHWSKYVGQLFGTDAGQRMRSHMNMVLDCDISMWDSREVVTPDGE